LTSFPEARISITGLADFSRVKSREGRSSLSSIKADGPCAGWQTAAEDNTSMKRITLSGLQQF